MQSVYICASKTHQRMTTASRIPPRPARHSTPTTTGMMIARRIAVERPLETVGPSGLGARTMELPITCKEVEMIGIRIGCDAIQIRSLIPTYALSFIANLNQLFTINHPHTCTPRAASMLVSAVCTTVVATAPGTIGLFGSKGVALSGSPMYKVTDVSLAPVSDTSVMMTWPGR